MAWCLLLPSRRSQQPAMGLGAMAGFIRRARECWEESQQLKAPSPSQSWPQYTSHPRGTRHPRMHACTRAHGIACTATGRPALCSGCYHV
jgi:hypothetical protein